MPANGALWLQQHSESAFFWDTLYVSTFTYTQISTYTNTSVYCACVLVILLFSLDSHLGRMGVVFIVEILDFGMMKSKRLINKMDSLFDKSLDF